MMKKLLLFVSLFFYLIISRSQSFTGTGGSVPSTGTQCFPINVSGVGTINTTSLGLSSVCIDITHPSDDELEVWITAPDGTEIPLTIQNGGSGNNYSNTCFSSSATNYIKNSAAPFTGSFIPEGFLGAANNGQNADGVWTLCVQDRTNTGNSGVLNSWALTFSNSPAPAAPAMPACNTTLPSSVDCGNATPVCDFKGLCGQTTGNTVRTWPQLTAAASCFNFENNTFIKFIASASTVEFAVWVPTSSLINGGRGGIEMFAFSGTCNGAVTPYGCFQHIYPPSVAGNPLPNYIRLEGLTAGSQYFITIDGFGGATTSFTIQAISGINTLTVSPDVAICKGTSTTLTASGGNGNYNWSPGSGLSSSSGASVTATPSNTTTYQVMSTNAIGCSLKEDVVVTVNDPPIILTQPSSTAQTVCQGSPATPFVVAAAGSGVITGYQWYLTSVANNSGGLAIPGATGSSYTPFTAGTGTLYFYCVVTNSNGCSTTSNITGAVTINPKPTAPTGSVTAPSSCANATGAIVLTAPTGVNFEYSIGGAYQASGTFTGLAAGSYTATVRNTLTGCVSSGTSFIVTNISSPPATPLGAVTVQPTCATPTGTIVITSPSGANIEYSIGGPYQASGTFSGLTNGTTYDVYAKDIVTGCISSPLQLTVNTIPGAPTAPTATVSTQTDCFSPTGTITITAPTGANYEYSIGGSYQSGLTFAGLAAASNFAVTVRNTTTGCVSAPVNLSTDAIIPPAPPTVSSPVTYCQNSTAAALTAVGSSLLWYTAASGGVGSAIAPTPSTNIVGSTTYYVSQTTGLCESGRSPITVNITNQPSAPSVTPTVNYCQNAATTQLTALGSNLLWYTSASGGTGTAIAPTPSSATAGITSYYVSQSIGSCESTRSLITVTINATPSVPAVNSSISYCLNAAATILTATGANLLWYNAPVGGSGSSAAPTPSTTASGVTNYYVSQTANGCEGPRASIAVTVNPIPVAPTVTTSFTYCENATASQLTATGNSLLWYNTASGGTGNSAAPTPSTSSAGNTVYYVSQTVNGCESPRASVTVTVNANPVLPTVTPTVTYCENDVAAALNATGSNLTWYTTATGGTGTTVPPTPSTTSAGVSTYYVSQTVNGCESGRSAITVTVNAKPTMPTVTTNISYCQDEIVSSPLTASGSNLQWYSSASGGVGSSIAPIPITTLPGITDYYVSQTLNGCESPRAQITVNIKPTPAVPITSNLDLCRFENSTALIATGSNLLWYTIANGGTGSTSAPIPSTSLPGIQTYYVTQTINGCESPKASVTVTIKSLPLAPIVTSPVIYCQFAAAIPLKANGSSLLWYNAASGGTGTTVAPIPSTSNAGNSFFYVSQTTNGCEGPRAGITVTIFKDSTAVTNFSYSPSTVCINATTNPGPALPVDFTLGGSFSASPAGLSIDAATGSINLALSKAGTYTVTYTYPNGNCIHGGSSSTTVQIDPAIPSYTVFSYSSPVCKNSPLVLPSTVNNFTTGGVFSSGPGLAINAATGAVNVGASNPGTYQIVYRLSTVGCRAATSNTSYIIISDTSSPVTNFSYDQTNVCITSSVNPVLKTANGFTTGGIFSSSPAGLNINQTIGAINIGLSTPGIYKIKYNVPQVLCRLAGEDSIIFTLNAYGNPETGFSYFSPVCKRDAVEIPTLNMGFTNGGVFSSTTGVSINAQTGVVDLSNSQPGTYTVKYDVAAGACNPAGSSSVPLTIIAQPQPPSVVSASICGPGEVLLNASAAGTIKWFSEKELINQINVGTSFDSYVENSTNYFVTNTVGSCSSEPSLISAVVNPLPQKPFMGNDTAICPNDKYILNPGNYANYLWQDGSMNSTFTVNGAGIYKVIVSTNAGCKDSTAVTVITLDNCDDILFPSAFTPDGNGLNDRFGPIGSWQVISNYSMRIFNRYGQIVFSSQNPAERWDGMVRGKKADVGNYIFVATYTYKNRISRTKKGSVMVIR